MTHDHPQRSTTSVDVVEAIEREGRRLEIGVARAARSGAAAVLVRVLREDGRSIAISLDPPRAARAIAAIAAAAREAFGVVVAVERDPPSQPDVEPAPAIAAEEPMMVETPRSTLRRAIDGRREVAIELLSGDTIVTRPEMIDGASVVARDRGDRRSRVYPLASIVGVRALGEVLR